MAAPVEASIRVHRVLPGLYRVLELDGAAVTEPRFNFHPAEWLEFSGRRDTPRARRRCGAEMVQWIREQLPGAQVLVDLED